MRLLRLSTVLPALFGVVALASGALWWRASTVASTALPPAELVEQARAAFLKRETPRGVFDRGDFAGDAAQRELHDPATVLPMSHLYEPEAIRAVYRYTRDCATATRPDPARLPPALAKALTWADSRCESGAALPDGFFGTPPFMHPSGASYVRLAFASGAGAFRGDAWLAQHARFAHVLELRRWPSLDRLLPGATTRHYLSRLPPAALAGLVAGDQDVLAGADVIFYARRGGENAGGAYEVHDAAAWRKATTGLPWSLEARTPSTPCEYGTSPRFCWARKAAVQTTTSTVMGVVAALSVVSLVVTLIVIAVTRFRVIARERADRLFIVRTLAHELRTPATALGLAIEELRPSFNDFSPGAQDAFLRLCDASQRLTRVIATSGRYLKAKGSGTGMSRDAAAAQDALDRRPVPSMKGLMSSVAAAWTDRVQVSAPAEDWEWRTDPTWFGLCVGNLLDNACRHGKPPVAMSWRRDGNDVVITVTDAGTAGSRTLDGLARTAGGGEGLGLGLALVRRAAAALGGRLEYQRRPTTTFRLRFPASSESHREGPP
jgi:hypothetical protein